MQIEQPPDGQRLWGDLPIDEQLCLREAYGHYLDSLPASCDMQLKVERFRLWLAERGIRYP